MDTPGSFGDWLRARRKALDLTQGELAGRAGCSVFALRKIESGERRPSKQLADLLAAALEISPEDRRTFVRAARGELPATRLRTPFPLSTTLPTPAASPAQRPLWLPPTPLLGRQSELAALHRLFRDPQCRLLTLTGMGGIGKTRLAIEFAARAGDLFPGGVYYSPLASINAAGLIVPAIADAVGFSFSGPVDAKEQLIDFLQHRGNAAALLVLDNFEHLLGTTAESVMLVSELLQRIPQLKILTTSRVRLSLHGEWMYELHGLPVPPTEYVDRLDEYSAAALFLQSARRIKTDFDLLPGEKPALVRICQLLEGIPLAIELAAAWVELLSCTEIAQEIEANIDFLQTGMRDVPDRHRSLRASFDHSWQLLSDAERAALCRLAIFRDGFDRLAAERVAGASLPLLASLVSKSLMRRGEDGRYDLHEVIRQLALSYLGLDSAPYSEARDAHSEHYLQFVAEREQALRSAPQQATARELINELDNLRAAWVWAIRREKFTLLGAAVRSVGWFFEVTGLIREGIEQFEPLVRALRARSLDDGWQWVLGKTLTQQGMLYFRRGIFERAQALLEESLSILRQVGDAKLLTDSLVYLGIMLHLGGDVERAQQLMEEGLCSAQAAGDDWFTAYAIYNLGYLDSLRGDYPRGYEQMLEGMSIWRKLGDPHSIALGLNYLVPTLVQLERYEEAETGLQESLALCEATGNRWGMGTAYRYLGLAKMAQGQLYEAQAHFQRSVETFGDYIMGWDIAKSTIYLGEAIHLTGAHPEARRVYQEALRLSRDAHSIPLMLEALAGLAELSLQKEEYEQAMEIACMTASHPASSWETRERAERIRIRAEACLGATQRRIIQERSAGYTLEGLVSAFTEPS